MKTTLTAALLASTLIGSTADAGHGRVDELAFQMKRFTFQLSRRLRSSFAFTPHYRSLRTYNACLYESADRLQYLSMHPHAHRLMQVEVEEMSLRLSQVTRLVEDLKDVVAGPANAHHVYHTPAPTLQDLEALCAIVDCMDETLLKLRTSCGIAAPAPVVPVIPQPPVVPTPHPPVLAPPLPHVQPPLPATYHPHPRPAIQFRKGKFAFSLVLN